MITLNIRHNFPEVMRALDDLPKDIAEKAIARTLNATIDQGKIEMARGISQEFRINVGDAKQRLYVTYSRYRGQVRLEAILEAKRPNGLHGNAEQRGMGIINFVETKTILAQAKKRAKDGVKSQVFFQIKRAGGKKFIRSAFIATNRKTGGTALFRREGKARYPIAVQTTIDIPQMFNTKRINEIVRKVMLEKFEPNFARELRSVLGGWVK